MDRIEKLMRDISRGQRGNNNQDYFTSPCEVWLVSAGGRPEVARQRLAEFKARVRSFGAVITGRTRISRDNQIYHAMEISWEDEVSRQGFDWAFDFDPAEIYRDQDSDE